MRIALDAMGTDRAPAPEVAGAIEMANTIHADHPDSPHFVEPIMVRLGFHLLSSWELAEEGVAVLRLNTEWRPRSVRAWETLGDGYLWVDDRDQAGPCYRKVLELDPEHGRARRILDWMEGPSDD